MNEELKNVYETVVYETVKKMLKTVFEGFEDGDIVTYNIIWTHTKALLPKKFDAIDWESDMDSILDEMCENNFLDEKQVWISTEYTTSLTGYELNLDFLQYFDK